MINEIIKKIAKTFDEELYQKSEDQLEEYWFFKWDETKSTEWNTYKFFDLLEIYKGQCRRWEEKHNGIVCVVERVRDKYLMPKIKEFLDLIKKKER